MNGYSERAASDLRWFFRESDGALGLKSNFAGMVASLEGGGWTPKPTHDVPLHHIEAAQRARRIHVKLQKCDAQTTNILRWAYSEADADASLLAVLEHNPAAQHEWKTSGTSRPIREWLARLAEAARKDRARGRLWLRLKALGLAWLENATDEFSGVQ